MITLLSTIKSLKTIKSMRTSRIEHRGHALGMAATLALACALGGCSSDKSESRMTSYSSRESKSATPQLFTIPQDQMSHVQVVTVQPTKLSRNMRLTGAVAYNAFKTTPVITQVGGPVTRILVVPGQHVHQGEPMLYVTSPDYSQLLDGYIKARETYRVADKNYARAQDLYQHNAIAERDLLQAESDRNQAQADLNASEQSMKILGIKNPEDMLKGPSSAEIPVIAPIGGEVVERLVSPGQVMQAGQTQAFTISDMSTVWVLANVYQDDLAYVKNGQDVVVQTDAYPDSFHGKISYVSAALDPNTRTLQARIVVDNPGEKLKKDMYCTATVTAGVIQNAIAVPDASVLRDDENQPFVYVTTGSNQFGRRAVEIGQSQNGQTQILKGLSAGENVAGDGSLFLQFANSIQH
jgi:cobalt-zinc-cadmium efflux system membrane fusion protein